LQEIENDPLVSIYSNPTNGTFALTTSLQHARASIYSVDGKTAQAGIQLTAGKQIRECIL
jgi:hypothetical protein